MKLRAPMFVVISSFALACSSGGPGELGGPGQTSTADAGSAAPTGSPAPAASAATAPSTGSAIGASCTAYFECCEEIVAKQPQLGASCDQTKSSIEEAQSKGVSTKSYESACASALTAAKSAGYCK